MNRALRSMIAFGVVAILCTRLEAGTITFVQGSSPDTSYQHIAAQILQNGPSANHGLGGTIQVGRSPHGIPPLGGPGNMRGVLGFDLSPIPAASVIESVSLSLAILATSVEGNPGRIDIHSITAGQMIEEGQGIYPNGPNEGVTWTSRRTGLPWTSPGGDFDALVLSTVPQTLSGTIVFPSTSAFVAAAQTSFGSGQLLQLMLIAPVAEADGERNSYVFYSDDWANLTLRPALTVSFTPPAVIPEPGSVISIALGLVGLAGYALARRRKSL